MTSPQARTEASSKAGAGTWLATLRRYLLFVAIANLAWEFAHLPLYTVWETGTLRDNAIAAIHCTGGDILIALTAVMLALLLSGDSTWPASRSRLVTALTVAFGLAYTLFSEWLNVEVRQQWAYSELMPVIPIVDVGLSPVLQWIVIPLAGLHFALRRGAARNQTPNGA